ncbi:hypothetical protein A4X13_0g6229 [Tilletia indica]|uniref:Septin-type G domain-containing protein n=1 Tax=Tilletia indica TaxID=43049 RepID=A0A8T8SPC7_9BASI|nr:hypothetical protein A4X13_0g6229 [Tilletia indica]
MPPLRVRASRPDRYHQVDDIVGHRINPTTQEEEAFVQWSKSYVPLYNFSNPEQARGDVNNIKQAERRQRGQRADARVADDQPHQDQPHQDQDQSQSLSGPTSSAPTQAASSVPRSTQPSTTPTQAPSSGLSTYSAPTQAPSSALSTSAPTQAPSSSSLPARPSSVPRTPQKRSVPAWRKMLDKAGAHFTLMVVGESGVGKTTLINTLFSTELATGKDHTRRQAKQLDKTVEVDIIKAELEVKQFKVKLTVIDTPGFGDYVDNRDSWAPIVDFIDDQHETYMRQEQRPERKAKTDLRVHACLHFIRATGHTLKPLDIEIMKRLETRVNLIPVIAKADTLTQADLAVFKQRIREVINHQNIKVYQPPVETSSHQPHDRQSLALACLIELLIRGVLAILIQVVDILSDGINSASQGIKSAVHSVNTVISSALPGVNDVLHIVGKPVSVPQIGVPDLTALDNVRLPTFFEDGLIVLNNSILTERTSTRQSMPSNSTDQSSQSLPYHLPHFKYATAPQ